jgi:hypothetical protein
MMMSGTPPRTRRLLIASLFGLVSAVLGAYAVLETLTLAKPLRVLVAAVPLAAFALFIVAEVREIRRCDELEQRIQLEALAVAYPVGVLLVYGLGLLARGRHRPGILELA